MARQLGIVLAPYGHIPGSYPWEISSSNASNNPQLTPYDPYYNQRGEPGWYHDTQLGDGHAALPGTSGAPSFRLPTNQQPQFQLPEYPQAPTYPVSYHASTAGGATPFGAGYETNLGAIPTDAEIGADRCYTPVMSGWINTTTGNMAPPWLPGIGPGPGLGAYQQTYLQDGDPGSPGPGAGSGTFPAGTPSASAQPQIIVMPVDPNDKKYKRWGFYFSIATGVAVISVSLVNLYRGLKAVKREKDIDLAVK